MKYLNTYKKFSNNIDSLDDIELFIESIDEGFKDFFRSTKKKLGNWIIKAPKVKKLQQKANDERLKAVHAQVETRELIELSLKNKKDVDIERLKTVMKKKVLLHLNLAKKHEDQANIIVDGNPYLEKVKGILKYEGEIKANDALLVKATEEEEYELEEENAKVRDQIDIDMDDLQIQIDSSDGGEEELKSSPQSTINILDKSRLKLSKNSEELTTEEINKVMSGVTLFMRSAIHELMERRLGKIPRKSSSKYYQMIGEMMKRMEEDKLSLDDAYVQVATEWRKEGKISPKDKIFKNIKL